MHGHDRHLQPLLVEVEAVRHQLRLVAIDEPHQLAESRLEPLQSVLVHIGPVDVHDRSRTPAVRCHVFPAITRACR